MVLLVDAAGADGARALNRWLEEVIDGASLLVSPTSPPWASSSFASNVLVSRIQGLGAEIAKNLVLAGIRFVTLDDDGNVELWDKQLLPLKE